MKSLKRAQRLLKEQYPRLQPHRLRRSAPLVRTAEDVERSERNLQIHPMSPTPHAAAACTTTDWRWTSAYSTIKESLCPWAPPVDHLGREAHITEEAVLVAQGKLTEQERENRLLLRQVMKEAGFHPLPSEWWHFNRVSRQTAKERYRVIP